MITEYSGDKYFIWHIISTYSLQYYRILLRLFEFICDKNYYTNVLSVYTVYTQSLLLMYTQNIRLYVKLYRDS